MRTIRISIALPLALGLVPAAIGADAPKAPELVAPTEARTPEEERAGFHLPPGFEIELVAAEPQIDKPMNIAFDDRGRLWVTTTLEYPFPVTDPGVKPRDRVVVLDGFGPDGRARRAGTFADGLNIPIGVLPIGRGDEALVHSIPNIYRLIDDDRDGRADRREVAYGVFGSKDTHGMTNSFRRGFDGWVYATHGFSNTSTVQGADAEPIALQSGNTYRMRIDGSHAEYFTHGQVNPFGLAWDPLGNLYSADCHSKPVYQLLRGAYYPSFGKPDDGLGFGPAMVKHDHGSTGIAGVVSYAAEQFPEPWRGTVFIGNVVTSRINHDRVDWHGSTPVGVLQPDFLTSDDPWFRPVDLEVGPDGALYVADFYNKIIGHYEVPLTHPGRDRERGRIWRIVYRGDEPHEAPEGLSPNWSELPVPALIDQLAHPNLAVRLRTADVLADHPEAKVNLGMLAAVLDRSSPERRAHALWVLQRRGALDDSVLEGSANAPDRLVRVHAQRVIAERPELTPALRAVALKGLDDPDAHVRRAAAEALGRHPDPEFIGPLLRLRHEVPAEDTHLLHVVRMALRDQLKAIEDWPALHPGPDDPDDSALADVAPGVPNAQAARFLNGYLQHHEVSRADRVRGAQHIARYGDEATSDALLAFARADEPGNLDHQAALLKAIAQGGQERGKPLTPEARGWALDLARRLIDAEADKPALAGIELAGTLKLVELRETLATIGLDRDGAEPRRVAALDGLVAVDPSTSVEPIARVIADANASPNLRTRAVGALAKVDRPEAGAALIEALPTAPAKLQIAIAWALARSGREGSERLLETVAAGKASARLLQDRITDVLLHNAGVPDLDARLATLTAGLPPADAEIQTLIDARSKRFASSTVNADPALGASIFEKSCGTCHQLGGQGARIGPQLDGVGVRGVDRLLEDILDPNRNVDQEFRTTTLALADGRVVAGLLLNAEGEVFVLADSAGKDVRVPKDQVDERKTESLSPMPANFADAIPEAEFDHLLAYLLSQRPPLGSEVAPASPRPE